MHVLPKGFHRIRHYGLLANGQREANLAKARELLRVKTIDPADDALRRADDAEPADAPTVLAAPVPLLRRPHAHHRDLRGRLPATTARITVERPTEGRHVMSRRPTSITASSITPVAGHAPAATALVSIAVE